MPYIINKTEFFLDHVNDKTFLTNTSDNNSHVLGSVMNKAKAEFEIDVYWDVISTVSLELRVINRNIIKRNYGDFLSDGFCIGDTVCLETPVGQFVGFAIQSLSTDTMVLDNNLPAVIPDGVYDNSPFLKISGTSILDGLVYKFGLVPNGDPASYNWIDGNEQAYSVGGLTPGVAKPMNKVGSICGWQTGVAQAQYIGAQDAKGTLRRYKISHEFIITPFYQDGEKPNLQNNIAPSIFAGTNSLNYVFQAEFRNFLTNPNCSKLVEEITPLGNVKWFNESLQGINEYSLISLEYDGDPNGCLKAGVTTQVCATIFSSSGNFTPTSKVGAYVSLLPDSGDYSNQTDSFVDNWEYDCFIGNVGNNGVLSISNPIRSYMFSYISANRIEICIDVNFSPGVTDQDCYLIAFDVSNNAASQQSDKTMLLIDSKTFDYSACVPDLLEVKNLGFYDHVSNVNVHTPTTDYKGHVEDGITACFDFCLDLDKGAFLDNLDIKLIAHNPNTGDIFNIDSYNMPLINQVIVPNGPYNVQQITLNSSQGFNLSNGSQYNFKKITTVGVDGNLAKYEACIGLKMCWQDWVALPGADSVFYDNSENNNGLNSNVSNYNLINGYQLKVAICHNVKDSSGIITPYLNLSPAFDICNYDAEADWSYVIETKDENDVNTNCLLLSGNDTKIKVTATYSGTSTPELSDMYGIIRIEPKNIPVKTIIDEGSTLRALSNNSYFTGLSVLTNPSPGVYCLENTIDGEKINKETDYKISFKLGCPGVVECLDVTCISYNGNWALGGDASIWDKGVDTMQYDLLSASYGIPTPTIRALKFRLRLVDINGSTVGQGAIISHTLGSTPSWQTDVFNKINAAIGYNLLFFNGFLPNNNGGRIEFTYNTCWASLGLILEEGVDDQNGGAVFSSDVNPLSKGWGVRLFGGTLQESINQDLNNINMGSYRSCTPLT